MTGFDLRSDGMVAEPASNTRVLRLESFQPAETLSPDQLDSFIRRMITLFDRGEAERKGGSGRVSRVRNIWGESFALKTLDAHAVDGCDQSALLATFDREYLVHRSVSGLKGFPRVYGRAFVEGRPCILMEWVEGVTLAKAARALSVDDDCRMSPLDAARIGRDLFEILVRLGSLDPEVVHGDLSAANVMVRTDRLALREQSEEGVFDLCIVDFGSASSNAFAQGGACAPAGSAASERTGSATREFAAPEALLRGPDAAAPGVSADVYAAASIVFLLAGGRYPFGGADGLPLEELIRTKSTCQPAPLRTAHVAADISAVFSFEPEVAVGVRLSSGSPASAAPAEEVRAALLRVDAQLDDLLLACLSPEPAKRPSARFMRDALGSFAFHYIENYARALRGQDLLPCAPGSLADGYGQGVRGRASGFRRVAQVACAAFSLIASIAAGAALGALPQAFLPQAPFSSGLAAGVAGGCIAFLPFACAQAGALLGGRSGRRLLRTGVCAVAGAALSAALSAAFGVVGSDARVMMAGAIGLSAVLGFAASLRGGSPSKRGFGSAARGGFADGAGASLQGAGTFGGHSELGSGAVARLEGGDAR